MRTQIHSSSQSLEVAYCFTYTAELQVVRRRNRNGLKKPEMVNISRIPKFIDRRCGSLKVYLQVLSPPAFFKQLVWSAPQPGDEVLGSAPWEASAWPPA
jgi:hypothetical protein